MVALSLSLSPYPYSVSQTLSQVCIQLCSKGPLILQNILVTKVRGNKGKQEFYTLPVRFQLVCDRHSCLPVHLELQHLTCIQPYRESQPGIPCNKYTHIRVNIYVCI